MSIPRNGDVVLVQHGVDFAQRGRGTRTQAYHSSGARALRAAIPDQPESEGCEPTISGYHSVIDSVAITSVN